MCSAQCEYVTLGVTHCRANNKRASRTCKRIARMSALGSKDSVAKLWDDRPWNEFFFHRNVL